MTEERRERRNDVGYKVTLTVFGGVLTLLLTLFINTAWTTANEGKNVGISNNIAIAEVKGEIQVLKANYDSIKDDLAEIKSLLKRSTPYERNGNVK